jgi:hypothetical protein
MVELHGQLPNSCANFRRQTQERRYSGIASRSRALSVSWKPSVKPSYLSSRYFRVLVRLRSPFWYRLIGFFGVVVTMVCFLEATTLATRALGVVCLTLIKFLDLVRIVRPTRRLCESVFLTSPCLASRDCLFAGFGSLGRAMMCLAALRWMK